MPIRTSGEFIAEIPEYSIEDGNMHIQTSDRHIVMPLVKWKRGIARAMRVVAEYEARKAEVVPLNSAKGSGRRRQPARSRN